MSVRRLIAVAVPVLALVAFTSAASATGARQAGATFVDARGNAVGWVRLVEDAGGTVHVNVHVSGLRPACTASTSTRSAPCSPTFAAAGGHYNPLGHQHGLLNPNGPHAGDLPNLIVNEDGIGHLTRRPTTSRSRRRPATLFDTTLGAVGCSFIIHANEDDQLTDATNGSSGAADRLRRHRSRVTRAVLGRYGETAMWIVVALLEGPRTAIGLLDAVRDLDGRIGPGRLLGAVARLERLELIERADGAYRLGRRVLSSRSQTSTM